MTHSGDHDHGGDHEHGDDHDHGGDHEDCHDDYKDARKVALLSNTLK